MFGVAPFWISLLWSQYIVIWYGDLPEETGFIYLRFYQMPWKVVTLSMVALAFIIPFALLMPRSAKLKRAMQLSVSLCVIAGLLIEKYVLIMPSFSPNDLSLGWIYTLVTVGFAVSFATTYRVSLHRSRL
jgi:hypothetical protein